MSPNVKIQLIAHLS